MAPQPGEADPSLHTLELGPDHPFTGGTSGYRLELDGEKIAALEVEIGHLHRGFEKECESRAWQAALPYTDRLNYHSAALSSTAYCLAVEKLFEFSVPVRARWLRVLAGELSRIADHASRLAALCVQLEALAAFARIVEARECILDLLALQTGARGALGYLRIGGVRCDLPGGFVEDASAALRSAEGCVDGFSREAADEPVVIERLTDTGFLSREDCVRYAVSGPIARASGLGRDLRKTEPYLVYGELDFSVPVGERGDNYDRLLVCLEEIRQSFGLVRQCLERLGGLSAGSCCSELPGWLWPRGAGVAGRALVTLAGEAEEAEEIPVGECYGAVESPNGELGFYLVSNGAPTPCKVRCRAPSFFNLQPLPQMVRGGALADLGLTIALVHSVDAERDR